MLKPDYLLFYCRSEYKTLFQVKEYLLLAIQNLQLAIYNQKYGNGSQVCLILEE